MIHEYSNYANKMICISDNEIKACIKASSCNIIDFVGTPPLLYQCLNVFIIFMKTQTR